MLVPVVVVALPVPVETDKHQAVAELLVVAVLAAVVPVMGQAEREQALFTHDQGIPCCLWRRLWKRKCLNGFGVGAGGPGGSSAFGPYSGKAGRAGAIWFTAYR